ncbi:MAG: flagellar M-ring protein FliF [Alphaproteobacteria bacterium]|nr:flagellar M-ring protein FliF [Alphaproteobacteria bacterium]
MLSFIQTLKNLGTARLAAMGGVLIFLMGFLIYLATQLGSTEMAVLFNELDPADTKKIIAQLDEQNVPYRLYKNGTEIHVPVADTLKLRVQLAETVNAGSVVGYEIFDKAQSPGVGHDIINLQMLRALEGELARTIKAIDNVKAARVHLVLPRREMFSREEQPPSASVIIRMEDKAKLTPKQVEAVQRLVAAAVPKMQTKDVSIMDARGTLLTKNFDDDEQMQMSTNEEMRRDYERRLISAVQSLIEQSVGQEKVRVQASLEMDFDQVVVNREIYDPEAQVLRSSTTIEESSQTDEREPIVSVEQNLPDAETQNANQVKQQANRTEETVNYEISKEVISQVRKNGVIKRLSVAVIVDGTYTLNPNGTKTYVPRTEKEMELLTTLVRSAVGYDANRGDTVEVINLPFFNPDDLLRLEDPILFMGFTKQEIMKMVEGLGVALVAVLVILLVVRPLIVKAFEQPENEEEENLLMGPSDDLQQLPSPSSGGVLTETDQLEELIDIAKVEGRVKASSVRKIGEIIDQHPEEAVSIIRSWMYSDE